MEKKQVIERAKAIVKQAYIELNILSNQVDEEQTIEDRVDKKLDEIRSDTVVLKKQLIG